MAYRRNLTTRAKFLYQQQRVITPAFCYPHDDDKKTQEPICKNPRFSTFLQPHYVKSGINSLNGPKSPFQDRRFRPSQHMICMSLGSMFTRNMSSSVSGGGTEKIEHISEVAELADKAVEVVTSQVPALNEVAVAAAESYLPVQALQYLIDYVHIFTGFDW